MDNKKYAAIAEAAAVWWVEAIQNPKFDNGSPEQGGSPIASILAMLTHKPQDSSAVLAFKTNLAKRIESELASGRHSMYGLSIGVDYHPDEILAEAANAAEMSGTEMSVFPWKTHMRIDTKTGTINVSHGYRAPMRQIYPSAS